MGGLTVTDSYNHADDDDIFKSNSHQHLVFNSGWGGMGLHGNHISSSNAIHKSTSAGSGLFFMDDDLSSGDEATGSMNNVQLPSSDSLKKNSSSDLKEGYIKTTNMANFYYKRNQSQENIAAKYTEAR